MRLIHFIKTLRRPKVISGIDLYLHTGMPKTGTTAIQSFLAYNREQLKKRFGVLYPDCGVPKNQHTALVKSMAANKFPWTHFNESIEAFDPENYIEQVVEECKQNCCNTVVLSSEFFWAAPAMQSDLPFHTADKENYEYIESFISSCKNLFDAFERTRVLVYLRRQDCWIDSFFNQQLKDGFDIPDPEQLLELKNYLLYYQNLRIWSKYFGKDNIIARVYDDDGNRDVLSDFISIFGFKRFKNHPRISMLQIHAFHYCLLK